MKTVSIALALASAVSGIVAALKWYRASGKPTWDSINPSASLNRQAAVWTAISIATSGLSSVAGAMG